MSTIEDLDFLEFNGVPNLENVFPEYERIASELMNHYILKFIDNRYRITEIEFYLKSLNHPDSYTHGHEFQKKFGAWYFHGSGLDITFGNKGDYGGILIRAIYNIDKKEYIYGPLNVITEFFKNIDNVNYQTLSFGLICDKNNIIEKEKPVSAPRVGLNRTKNPEMVDKPYRFLIMTKKKHPGKEKMKKAMKDKGYPESEIKAIWG